MTPDLFWPDNPTSGGILDIGYGRKIDVSQAQPQWTVPTLTDIPSGRALKLAGIARTLDAERAEWIRTALERLGRYARERAIPEFVAEDFRRFWLDSGRPEPHSHHVWGALFNRAASEGLIRATGRYVRAKSAKTRAHPVAEWIAA